MDFKRPFGKGVSVRLRFEVSLPRNWFVKLEIPNSQIYTRNIQASPPFSCIAALSRVDCLHSIPLGLNGSSDELFTVQVK